MRISIWVVCATLTACSPPAQPAPAPLVMVESSAPPRSDPAPPRSTAPAAVAEEPRAMRVGTAMAMEGQIDPKKLMEELGRQLVGSQQCVDLIRKTDSVVESLNVQVTVLADGATQTALQSPMNVPAQRCLQRIMDGWRARAAGPGKAMVLLVLPDPDPPVP